MLISPIMAQSWHKDSDWPPAICASHPSGGQAAVEATAAGRLRSTCLWLLLPFREMTSEIAARTQPNTIDLVIALVAGAVRDHFAIQDSARRPPHRFRASPSQ